MNKLTTTLIGTMFFASAVFTGQSAFAAVPQSCDQYDRHNISKFDIDFNGELDKDGDGMICELKTPAPTSTSGTLLGPDSPFGNAPGQSGTKGNGGEHSSGSNPNSQNSNDPQNNKDRKELANTGWASAAWAGIGALALLFGLVFTFFLKRKSA